MSEQNLELVRRSFEAINMMGRTGEEFVDPEVVAPEAWAGLAPSFELHERPDLPDGKVYSGRDEAKGFWQKTQEVFAEIRWEPLEFTDLGHAVVVRARVRATGRGSDVPAEFDETDVFWFRDGLIVRLQGFATTQEAMEAARLSG